jgi:hypothetical protein
MCGTAGWGVQSAVIRDRKAQSEQRHNAALLAEVLRPAECTTSCKAAATVAISADNAVAVNTRHPY